jgi:hypothetical protein
MSWKGDMEFEFKLEWRGIGEWMKGWRCRIWNSNRRSFLQSTKEKKYKINKGNQKK